MTPRKKLHSVLRAMLRPQWLLLLLVFLSDHAVQCIDAGSTTLDDVEHLELFKSLDDSELPVSSSASHSRPVRETCGGVYSESTLQKVITSPNYPGDYHNSANCFYTIEVPPGHYVEIVFEDFRIEIPRTSSSNCTYDGLTVRDGSPNGEPMGRYCGKVQPPDFRSRTNVVHLHLYSDESLGFRGFKIRYAVHCGAVFFSEHGTLRFSETEVHISPRNQCEYELTATPDHYLDLNFTVVDLSGTVVSVYDHDELVRTLRTSDYQYIDMTVRVVSIRNVVRLRFEYSGTGDGNAVIAYQAHKRALLSGSPIFLFSMITCKGLALSETRGNSAVASKTTKDAVLHRIERVGGHTNDTITAGNEVYIRTVANSSGSNYQRPSSLTVGSGGRLVYEDYAHDNSTWLIRGELRHGGRVWFENKQMTGQFLGVFGQLQQQQQPPQVSIEAGVCSNPVDWLVLKVPLDFGWDKYSNRGAYTARWVDGLPTAAYQSCLPHPSVFPRCDGSPLPGCLSA